MLKQRLRARFQNLRLQSDDGQICKQEWLAAVVSEIATLDSMHHAHFFERVGISSLQTNLKLVENEVISQADVTANPRRPPSAVELAEMLGRVNVPFYKDLMQWYPIEAGDSQRPTCTVVTPSQQASSSHDTPAT